MMMSTMVKSRECTDFSTSAMLVMSRSQATTGQASISNPKDFHAPFRWAGRELLYTVGEMIGIHHNSLVAQLNMEYRLRSALSCHEKSMLMCICSDIS